MKRLLSTVVVLSIMATLAAGCGSNTTSTESSSSNASQTASASTSTVEEQKEVIVTMMHHMGEDTKRSALKAWTDGFTKENQNIKFEVTNITDVTQYRNSLKTKLAAGDPTDMIFGNAAQYKDIVNAGHIADLTDQAFVKNIDDNVLKGVTIDGKVRGVAIDVAGLVVFYNKDIFSQNGLSIPTTYDEYLKVCATLKSKNIMPEAWGLKDSWIANVETQMDVGLIFPKVPNIFKDVESRTKKFSDIPEFKRAFERTAQRIAFQQGDVMGTDHNASVQMFATGKAAMLNQGTWDIGAIRAANKSGNFGVFSLPADKAEDTVMRVGADDCWMLAEKSPNKEAAIKFLEYAISPDGGKTWAEMTNTISSIKGVDKNGLDPMAQDVIKIMESGKSINPDTIYALSGQMSTYLDMWSQEFVVDKDRNVDAYIEKLDKQFDTLAKTK